MTHDTSQWAAHFKRDHLEVNLADALVNGWPLLYWLMRMGDKVLEVGAGTGRSCILLKRLQPWKQVTALDVDPEVCEIIRANVKEAKVDVKVVQGDAFRLPYRDGEFDVTFSAGLWEHYEDEEIVKGLGESLRVAQEIVVSVPTANYFETYKGQYGDERRIHKLEWLRIFSQAGALAELSFIGNYTEEIAVLAVLRRI